MKKILFVVGLLLSSLTYSQVSVTTSKKMNSSELNSELVNNFKKTTTVFVLKDKYTKEEYTDMLNSFWNVTPFEVVLESEFNYQNYLSTDYSLASINFLFVNKSQGKPGSAANLAYFKLDLRVFNNEQIEKIKSKISKGKNKDLEDTIAKNSDDIAHVIFQPKILSSKVGMALYSGDLDVISNWLANENDAFYNYSLGVLKNYFQSINTAILSSNGQSLYEEVSLPELSQLKTKKLVIPNYMRELGLVKENDLKKNYSYGFEFQTLEEIDERIKKEEEFYYLQHTLINSDKFIQIINSKTGKVVLKNYSVAPLAIKFKKKHISLLDREISKY